MRTRGFPSIEPFGSARPGGPARLGGQASGFAEATPDKQGKLPAVRKGNATGFALIERPFDAFGKLRTIRQGESHGFTLIERVPR